MSGEGDETQWFSPTSGRFSGWLGVAAGLVIAAVGAWSREPAWAAGGLTIALVVWLILLRPRVGLRGRVLLLRGIVSTVELPLSLVTGTAVRQVFVAWVGEKRYVNASIGRSMRSLRPAAGRRNPLGVTNASPELGGTPASFRELKQTPPEPYTDHLLELIRSHQADAKRWGGDGDAVRRHWAVRELTALAVLVVVTALLALL